MITEPDEKKQAWIRNAVLACLDTIEENEGWKELPYLCPAGRWTIGFGLQIKYINSEQRMILGLPAPVGNSYTREEIKALPPIEKRECKLVVSGKMREDANQLLRRFPWMIKLDSRRAAVLLDMAYNMGLPRLCRFYKTLKLGEEAVNATDTITLRKLFRLMAAESLDSLWAKQVPNRAARNADILEG